VQKQTVKLQVILSEVGAQRHLVIGAFRRSLRSFPPLFFAQDFFPVSYILQQAEHVGSVDFLSQIPNPKTSLA
jgi:hypothetical protein